jgi:hypothetical protein
MPTCRSCCGTGRVYYEEDGRNVRDVCYHCCNTGYVDEDLDFHDRLKEVAHSLAYYRVLDYKRARNNSDHYEEDFAFCAAENQMTERDYFTVLVWDEESEIMKKLLDMSLADQELLIAWNEYKELPPFKKNNVIPIRPIPQDHLDDIPF